MLSAAERREERQLETVAIHAAWLVNCWVKKPISAFELLGKKAKKKRQTAQDVQHFHNTMFGKEAAVEGVLEHLDRVRNRKKKSSSRGRSRP
jgi:hypothetical protein